MGTTTHLAWRAVLAILLMVSFYGLALLIVAVLVVIPLGLIRLSFGLALKVGLFTLLAAYGIVKAIFPRRDRVEAPGPRITPKDQPRLFQEIRHVAHAVGQPEPAEVYVIPHVNAFVDQRGGFMGLGSRRVMGLGLPLMQILTVAELRGVLAHEFGHFHGGDVAISPWVRETSSALGRTLEEMEDHSQVLMAPFVWYANLFFRLTHAVARHQELLADQVAVSVAGARVLARALQRTHGADMAFSFYWQSKVEPVLDAGFRPPLAKGFGVFLQSPEVQGKIAESLKELERIQPQSAHDTHPPLNERLGALGVDPSRTDRDPSPGGLPDVDPLEAADDIVGLTLALAFSRASFTVKSQPGQNHVMVGQGERVDVFSLRERLSKGTETPETWRALCTRTGIADVDLGSIANPSPASGGVVQGFTPR